MTIVMKFGGTSMADVDTIRRCAALVRAQERSRVVTVVSAMSGVTDRLIELAHAAQRGQRAATAEALAELRERHTTAAAVLGVREPIAALLDELETLIAGIAAVGELTPRTMDAVLSFGERLAAPLMAAALGGVALTGGEAGIVTDDNHRQANPLMRLSLYQVRQALAPRLERSERVVVTGFVAATQHGVITTIGRGGSDYTASILGAALKSDEIWIWSDVDGLMTADPRIVPEARRLERISFAEAIEMGQFGAKSMHPRALEPAAEHGIPVRMRNTFNPGCPGTLIGAQAQPLPPDAPQPPPPDAPQPPPSGVEQPPPSGVEQPPSTGVAQPPSAVRRPAALRAAAPAARQTCPRNHPPPVRSVLRVRNAALVNVTGAAMVGVPGTAAQVFGALADAGVNVQVISQSVSEASISIVLPLAQLDAATAALERRLVRTGVARRIEIERDAEVVAVVGAGMAGVPGVAARVFSAVADEGINVMVIAQGSSELSICFVVHADAAPAAVRALHAAFELA